MSTLSSVSKSKRHSLRRSVTIVFASVDVAALALLARILIPIRNLDVEDLGESIPDPLPFPEIPSHKLDLAS